MVGCPPRGLSGFRGVSGFQSGDFGNTSFLKPGGAARGGDGNGNGTYPTPRHLTLLPCAWGGHPLSAGRGLPPPRAFWGGIPPSIICSPDVEVEGGGVSH